MNRHHAWIFAILALLCTIVAQAPAATISIFNDAPEFNGAFRKDFSTECSDTALSACEVSILNEDVSTLSGSYRDRNYSISWDLVLDADPGISGTINITNLQSIDQFFATEVSLVVQSGGAVPAGGLMSGSSNIFITTTNDQSATASLSAAGGDSIYSGIIAGTTERELFSAAYGLSITPPTLLGSDSDSFSSETTSTSLGVGDVLALRHAFVLTANDTATAISSFIVVVPSPTGSVLLWLGALGLCFCRRKRTPR